MKLFLAAGQHTYWQWQAVFGHRSSWMTGVGMMVSLMAFVITSSHGDEVFSPSEGNEHRHIQLSQGFSREIDKGGCMDGAVILTVV